MTPFSLGLIGLILAYPAPATLTRMRWPYLAPRAAVILWQAIGLAAILAVVGAGLSTALWLVVSAGLSAARIAAHFAVLALTIVVGARLLWSLVAVSADTRKRRARHRELVDVLAEHDDAAQGLRILEDHTPIAYCVPDRARSRVVVSRGAVDNLTTAEFDAVLEHERAHVSRRHDLVLEGFMVLRHAFPRIGGIDNALQQCQILIELLADDAARRRCGRVPLARALASLAQNAPPAGTLGAGSATLIRLQRLDNAGGDHPGWAALAWTLAGVVLAGPTVFLAVPWIHEAWLELT